MKSLREKFATIARQLRLVRRIDKDDHSC